MIYASLDGFTIVILIIGLILLIPLLVFAIYRKREHLSGRAGEKIVNIFLESLRQDGEVIINDFIASRNRNGTQSIQIDHIFISYKGIFVIETKDLSGRIYGDAYQTNWTQVLAYGNVKHRHYNPIKQNETHVNYIKKVLGDNLYIFNIVIFTRADVSRVSNGDYNLFYPNTFRKFYRSLPNIEYMSNYRIDEIKDKLVRIQEAHQISKEDHVKNVKQRH